MERIAAQHDERKVILWLQDHGFRYDGDGRTFYHTETNQKVKITPANRDRWLADLNRRKEQHFRGFSFKLPTAEQMQARWTPEGIAKAAERQQAQMLAGRAQVAGILHMATSIGRGPAW